MSENAVPSSVGFILDGNRRWAKENGLPQLEGHRRGMEKVKDILRWARAAGVKEVCVYAFSTENWNRSPEEVSYLMNLFEEFCDRWADELKNEGGRLRFVGERARFSETLQSKMEQAEAETKDGTGPTLIVALSYGGRAEIVAGVNRLLQEGATQVTEASFEKSLWSAGMEDPDIIIRTGGEHRLSNFMMWRSAYSELFFTDTKLPAFTKEEFDAILAEYATRDRRRGR